MSPFRTGMSKPRVVRCLFAIDDNDRAKMNQELDNQAQKIDEAETKRFIQRWGFDPVKGAAVEGGAFDYTQVTDRSSVPAVYTSGFRRRPSRPVSMLRVRSPCLQARNVPSPAGPRPTKRKLRFDDDEIENAVSVSDISDVVSTAVFVNSTTLSSPPASPPASSLQQASHSPPSPSVLSSSCPPVLESSDARSSSDVAERLCPKVDVPGLSRSLSASTVVDLSPGSLAREYITPEVRPRKLVQREITDYVPIRKRRTMKASPRS